MNTDCAFYIGSTHKVCQDYALAGKSSVAVSDGCSGSSYSDIGSRVLSITAMNKMKDLYSLWDFDANECILLARPAIKMLNMPNECLDATLLSAVLYEEDAAKTLEAMCYGDGVIAIKMKDGDIVVINCTYTDNFPFYINYMYDPTDRYKDWTTNHNQREIILSTIKPNRDVETKEFTQQTRIKDIGLLHSLDNKTWVELVDIEQVEYIAVMSDGIHSFYESIITETSRYNESISYIEVLKDLLTFKNFKEQFVQRRVNKFRKNCIKKNWANGDDFSLAAIYVG